MLNWLLRVLGLGPQETPGTTTATPPHEQAAPLTPFDRAPTAPVAPASFDHEPVEPAPSMPFAAHAAPPAAEIVPPAAAFLPTEPVAPPTLHFAAFAVQSLAGGRVFARLEDGHLVHLPGDTAPDGWEVHGFVTDAHPGILFVLAAEGPTAISGGGAIAHAFRIEESGDDAFALFDLATGAYLCAPQSHPGVNTLANDRGVVDEWEMFHLVAAEGVTLPAVLPPLLPPAGTPITEERLRAWRAA